MMDDFLWPIAAIAAYYPVMPLFRVFPEFRVFTLTHKNKMFWKLYRKFIFEEKIFCVRACKGVGVFLGFLREPQWHLCPFPLYIIDIKLFRNFS